MRGAARAASFSGPSRALSFEPSSPATAARLSFPSGRLGSAFSGRGHLSSSAFAAFPGIRREPDSGLPQNPSKLPPSSLRRLSSRSLRPKLQKKAGGFALRLVPCVFWPRLAVESSVATPPFALFVASSLCSGSGLAFTFFNCKRVRRSASQTTTSEALVEARRASPGRRRGRK